MYKIWSAIENVFSKMRKYPVPTKEEAEELKRLRQEAGMTIYNGPQNLDKKMEVKRYNFPKRLRIEENLKCRKKRNNIVLKKKPK